MKMRNDEGRRLGQHQPHETARRKERTLAPSHHLRPTLGTTRASRMARPTLSLTLLLSAALALSACGGAQQSGAAAIVDGKVIKDQDVQVVSSQLNAISQDGQKLSPDNAVLTLILAPYVLAEAKRLNKSVSDADARKVIAKVAKPAPSTVSSARSRLPPRGSDKPAKAPTGQKLGKAKTPVNPGTAPSMRPISRS